MNRLLRLFTCVPYACAALHHLLTPSTSSNAVYALEFDDASGTLSLIAESTTVDMHLSIAVDNSKKFVHAGVSSNQSVLVYTLDSSYELHVNTPYALQNQSCDELKQPITLRLFSSPFPPYNIYTTVTSDLTYEARGCSAINFAAPNGTVNAYPRSEEYSQSWLDIIAYHPDGKMLYALSSYSNIMMMFRVENDGIIGWNVHEGGLPGSGFEGPHVTGLIVGIGRHYATIGVSNELALIKRDGPYWPEVTYSGSPAIVWNTMSVLLNGTNSSLYYTSSLTQGPNRKYLWITSPARAEDTVGYLTVYETNTTSGEIIKKVDQASLDATGSDPGQAVKTEVVAAPFSDDHVAITSSRAGQVEIWRLQGEKLTFVSRWEGGDGYGKPIWID